MKKNFTDKEKQFVVTFTYADNCTQTVYWDKKSVPYGNVEALAEQWRNDIGAKSYKIK